MIIERGSKIMFEYTNCITMDDENIEKFKIDC